MGLKTIPSMNPQFQAQYDEEQRKMELAKALMAQSQKSPLEYLEQPRTAQMAKLGLGPAIAPLIQAITGGLTARNAQQGMAGAQTANANEVASGKEHYALMPDKQKAIASLLTSMNPELQRFGENERTRMDTRLDKVTELQGRFDAPGAINTYLGGDPDKAQGLKMPAPRIAAWKDPATGKEHPYFLNPGEGGVDKATSFGMPSSVSVSADARTQEAEGKGLIEANIKGLAEGKEKAQVAQASIANASRVIDGLEKGAKVGGGQSPLQAAREWGKTFFGLDIPETGITAETRAALGQAVLDNARKLAPVTAEDVRRLEKMLGSIETDPAALPALMAWQTAKGLKAIQEYEKQSGMLASDSKFGNQYAALGVGAGMPQILRGPLAWKMQVLQELQREGGDPVPLLKVLDPTFNEKDGIPTFDFSGGPIRSKEDIAKALIEAEKQKKALPPGVRRSR